MRPDGPLAALLLFACGSGQEPVAAPRAERAGPAERPGPAKRPAGPPRGDELVRLHLLADLTSVAPGQELTLAARFDMDPGWHIYWTNPGESGLPTDAAFSAPAGFQVGPVRFPGPIRFDSPGDITSYGYAELAVLSAVVAAPERIAAAKVRFSVRASWLACREVCVRGQGESAIELPVASARQPAQPAHPELFGRHRESLPRPLAELAARTAWQRNQRQASLTLEVPRAERLEYFPPSGEDLSLIGQASVPVAGGARLELAYKPATRPARARGVLAVTSAGTVRYYALDLEESR